MKKELTKIQKEDQVRMVFFLRERGHSLQSIGDILNIPKSTVQKILKELNPVATPSL